VRFDVVTLFPELFAPFLETGVTRRAFASRQVDVRLWPLRDFAQGAYRRVDDRPFGGGPGMVMLAEPLERALQAVRASRIRDEASDEARRDDADGARNASARNSPRVPVVLFTPAGRPLDQALVRQWSTGPGAILLCGRYEGVDQRVIDRDVDVELSLGDFVLSGGELPALALLDAVARLLPGVLGDEQSHLQDSFEDGLLDWPHYSRPEVLAAPDAGEQPVPPVLLSGHHAAIARWRRERSLALTAARRPDLVAAARAHGRLDEDDERFLAAWAAARTGPDP
jgi:tRNA (guanine37-N1)-methyltransferase